MNLSGLRKWLAATALVVLSASMVADACTSAIVAAHLTADGRPLLWKNRDTGEENNKVERVDAQAPGQYDYIALYNASDSLCREAWMGMNTAGFAVMNTASYNLNNDTITDMDKEGLLMTKALLSCRTVDDFEQLLKSHPKPLRVEANFGVIDAEGGAAYFETGNRDYVRYNVADTDEGFIVRTNYSHSGDKNHGSGFTRENNALILMRPHVVARDFTPATFTEELSRTFFNSLLDVDYTHSGRQWIVDQDFIPRRITSATCVIEGVNPGMAVNDAVMWVGLGYGPCSTVRAATFAPGGVPDEIRGSLPSGHASLCDDAVRMKHEVFSLSKGNGKNYLDLSRLYNQAGTGVTQMLINQNLRYYQTKRLELGITK